MLPLDYILHIHGYWEAVDSMVLDRSSYDEISNDAKMQQVMQLFARWHTMLFIGCCDTLIDPNFSALINWCNKTLKGSIYRHFILCKKCDEQKFIEILKPYGFIQPLIYGSTHDDLVPFLKRLAADSGAKTVTANPQIPSPSSDYSFKGTNIQKAADIWKLQTQR